MRIFSKKTIITAGTILAATVTSLFAEQGRSVVFAVDTDARAWSTTPLYAGYDGYLGSNVVAVEGCVAFNATAPGAPLVVTAPGYCIKNVNGKGRIYINELMQLWKECWGYDDAVDISSNNDIAYAVTSAGELIKSVAGSDFSSAGVPQLPDNDNGNSVFAARVDVDDAGNPWVVGSDDSLYKLVDGAFVKLNLMLDVYKPYSRLEVLDVGANSGTYTVVAKVPAWFNTTGKLFSFDAASCDMVYSHVSHDLRAVDIDNFGNIYAVENQPGSRLLTATQGQTEDYTEVNPGQYFRAHDVGVQ